MEDDNETWIIDAGDVVIERRAEVGMAALQPLEQLIYCLWVADYGMRNAGDLEAAADLYAPFQEEVEGLSKDLGLPLAHAAFELSRSELERQYFELFEGICNEIRTAQSAKMFGE
ncbi:hypothetical protein [Pelagibius sp. Alg239-R121]|uniref:hypothetical protein n=1 Tax=Pelagibius sp. Alg239-R121 TaxID=2993448 RepID=UPI0024A6FC0F|nr:hypothetical protein [Pelagibius sp. Alg239-R121]